MLRVASRDVDALLIAAVPNAAIPDHAEHVVALALASVHLTGAAVADEPARARGCFAAEGRRNTPDQWIATAAGRTDRAGRITLGAVERVSGEIAAEPRAAGAGHPVRQGAGSSVRPGLAILRRPTDGALVVAGLEADLVRAASGSARAAVLIVTGDVAADAAAAGSCDTLPVGQCHAARRPLGKTCAAARRAAPGPIGAQ